MIGSQSLSALDIGETWWRCTMGSHSAHQSSPLSSLESVPDARCASAGSSCESRPCADEVHGDEWPVALVEALDSALPLPDPRRHSDELVHPSEGDGDSRPVRTAFRMGASVSATSLERELGRSSGDKDGYL